MLLSDVYCPVHFTNLVDVAEKPEYYAKCAYKICGYGIAADDRTMRVLDYSIEPFPQTN
jgi:hypothetical protein